MGDVLARRGPDEAGHWSSENTLLAHRRLAVVDRSETGSQPMETPDGRYHLVYNGELYNDDELRDELLESGAVPGGFRGTCDTETVLWAFATWGPACLDRLRGMFALAVYDSFEETLHLARDPLGIKPLYYHLGSTELSFASETAALLRHPRIEATPDLPMVSAYLSTLRTSLGSRTLFHGIQALRPGEHARFDARSGRLNLQRYDSPRPVDGAATDARVAAERVRGVLEDSVLRHLHADAPLAALLSGGLDSAITCAVARERIPELNTWCAGALDADDSGTDLEYAALAAEELGTRHHEVRLDRTRFTTRWSDLTNELGLPLSTPNEVAIHALAEDIRSAGFVVALSGEGADELFGGYELALESAAAFCSSTSDKRSGGRYQLDASAWVPPSIKPHLLSAEAWVAIRGDEFLFEHTEHTFRECQQEAGDEASPLDAHLRFMRKNNLTGLLRRLDTATMASSIEGRTPFADREVLELADSLPISVKWGARGKQVLRDAFKGQVPAAIIERSKQSFPLPFQSWIAETGWRLETSPFARTIFADGLRREVAQDAGKHWQLAWPMINLSLWGDALWS